MEIAYFVSPALVVAAAALWLMRARPFKTKLPPGADYTSPEARDE